MPTNEKQMTAVEWLQEAISKKVNNELGPYFIDLFDNAKAMEKEQIINAWKDGAYGGGQFTTTFDNADDYYNETYNKII
jgi:disulfide oxidoreductase YuzD